MKSFQLTIVTPKGKIFDQQVESVSVPGVEGSFGVLYNHAPFISTLKQGVVRVVQEGTEEFFAIAFGVFEYNHRNKCILLTDEAIQTPTKELAKEKLSEISSQFTF